MNAIFICVIVLDKTCFHMLNLCWFKHKNIFECFRCFWKVFCFYKNWKISKTVLPCFSNSVAGHPSLMPQSRARRSVLATCSRVKVQSRGVQRDFRSSVRDSLASETSNRKKHLTNFFKSFGLKCFGRCTGDWLATCISREKSVFCISKIVFKTFSVFPSNFLCLFTFSLDWNWPKHSMSPSSNSISASSHLKIFKKKVWVFSVSFDFSCFEYYLLDFWAVTMFWDILCLNIFFFFLRLLGLGWLFLLLISFANHNLFSLC